MKWESEFGPAFLNYDIGSFNIYAAILAEGIEKGLAELETLQAFGEYCAACGKFRLCDSVYLDQGLCSHELCAECHEEILERGHTHRCQQCDRIIEQECHCKRGPNIMTWCSSRCRAAYDL